MIFDTFNTLKTINAIIFLVIALFHIYWAFGGKFGSKSVIPEIEGKATFNPPFLATIFVALAMLVCSFLSIIALKPIYKGTSPIFMSSKIEIYAQLALGIIFMLRAIGDFKYAGFSKKVKGTNFAKNDTKYYSPLCVLISVIAFYIYWNIR
jgi:magnesium-transporting ATPase (P-type)